jgi:hypothetical protein
MCDYSLHDVASRPAKVGDKLMTTQFANSITRGFAAVGEPNVAVCLLPGTEVAFEKEIECLGSFLSWKRTKRIGDKVARFRQVNKDQNSRTASVCCSLGSAMVNSRPCCNYQLLRARSNHRVRQKLQRGVAYIG